jgi:hypothetical protein
LFALTLGLLPAAPAPAAARVPTGRLVWRPPARALPRFIAPPPAERAEPGVWVGPMFLEGRYARVIRKLPDHMQKGMAKPTGVGPLHVPNGAGLGFYARYR